MNLPPKDVAASDLFLKLTSTTRPHRITDIPRKGPDGKPVAEVALVVLSQEEMNVAAAEAERRTRKLLGADIPKKEDARVGYEDCYNNLAAVEILFRACKDPADTSKSAFRTPHEIQSGLTSDEVGVLFNAYLTVQRELGPIVSRMSDDEVEAWIKVLAEGGTSAPLELLSWGALTTLVLSMAKQLHPYLTAKYSDGLLAAEIEKMEAEIAEDDS